LVVGLVFIGFIAQWADPDAIKDTIEILFK
jgi:hypothetical protein